MYKRRRMYLRRTKIKNISKRQDYLTSKKKQEYLLSYSTLNMNENFKNISKEIILELPNEFVEIHDDPNLELNIHEIRKLYEDVFRKHTGYENIASAIHMNKKETNLHIHLTYIDRVKELDVLKTDKYIYASTGKEIKQRSKYDENNPNHLKIEKGSPNFNYDDLFSEQEIIDNKKRLGRYSKLDNKKKFQLRREIESKLVNNKVYKYSNCIENDKNLNEIKEMTDSWNNIYVELSNKVLEKANRKSFYMKKDDENNLSLPMKKIGKEINGEYNKVQEKIWEYNWNVMLFNYDYFNLNYKKFDKNGELLRYAKNLKGNLEEKINFFKTSLDILSKKEAEYIKREIKVKKQKKQKIKKKSYELEL